MLPTIAVFDSGVGGLSILSVLRQEISFCNYIYCSDNKNFPYGPASEDDVIRYALETTEKLTANYNIDLLVVACNTASTVALPSLRAKYPFPIVGVVPAIKPAANQSQSKVIGLLATPGTIKRAYTQILIDQFAKDCQVVKIGSSALVRWAEDKLRGLPIDKNLLQQELLAFSEEKALDIVVLACTHFPLIKEEIAACLPSQIKYVDSALAIAKRVKELLKDLKVSDIHAKPYIHATYTEESEDMRKLKEHLAIDFGFTNIKVL